MEFRDRTVIVTASESGIGRALALEFGHHGARVVCCGQRQERLEETVERIGSEGGKGLAVPTDLTKPDQNRSSVS